MRFLILILLLVPAAQGAVLEISDMKTTVHVAEKAHFKYEITLRNLIDKPLVPGVSELGLQKVENPKFLIFPIPLGERRGEVDVENLKAYSGNMNFKSYYEKHGDYSSIYYEIWYPIEPFGERTVVVEFDADIVEKRLLFKSITFPVGSDIEVKNLQISISSDWNLCYREGDIKSHTEQPHRILHSGIFHAAASIAPHPRLCSLLGNSFSPRADHSLCH